MNIEVRKSNATDIIAQSLAAEDVTCERSPQADSWRWRFTVGGTPCSIDLTGQALESSEEDFHRVLGQEIDSVYQELIDARPIRRGDTLRDNSGNTITFEGGI